MRIKRCPVQFHNVIESKVVCKPGEWPISIQAVRNDILRNGLYGVGPVMYRISEMPQDSETDELIYQFRIPVNRPVRMVDGAPYTFTEHWLIEDALVIRHPDAEEGTALSCELLRACAQEQGLELEEPFHHIYLDVYGGGVIDIVAPIVAPVNNYDSFR